MAVSALFFGGWLATLRLTTQEPAVADTVAIQPPPTSPPTEPPPSPTPIPPTPPVVETAPAAVMPIESNPTETPLPPTTTPLPPTETPCPPPSRRRLRPCPVTPHRHFRAIGHRCSPHRHHRSGHPTPTETPPPSATPPARARGGLLSHPGPGGGQSWPHPVCCRPDR
jgi:hypothetical protein